MSQQRSDAEALAPDRTIEVMGRDVQVALVPTEKMQVQVREFTFGQALYLEKCAQPIVEAMGEAIEEHLDSLHWGTIMAAVMEHTDAFIKLLSASTGLTQDQLDAMHEEDGRLVVATFVRVNWDFFLRRLVERSGTKVTMAQVSQLASQMSSPGSSATGTATPPHSH